MKYRLLTWLLATLLLLAACAGPTEPTDTAKEAAFVTTTQSIPQGSSPESNAFACDAVFFGDSITCDGNFDELFPELRVVNLGVYGNTLEQLLYRVSEVRAERPARIFLLGGINSLLPDNVEKCLEQYELLLDELRTACPRAEIVVESVLPVGAELDPEGELNDAVRSFNEGLKSLAGEYELGFADLYAVYEKNGVLDPALTRDGVHLNFNAYGPWAEIVAPYMPKN